MFSSSYYFSLSPIEKTKEKTSAFEKPPSPTNYSVGNSADRISLPHKMSNTIRNNNDNNNNFNINNNNIRTSGTQACAACKYQRRKCASDCLLAPYFPHHLHHQFLNAHKLFGVSNITKIIRHLPQPQKDEAMRTIMIESDARAFDPVRGSCRMIHNLQRQIEFAYAELDLVMQQLAVCRATAAVDTASLICDLDPMPQPQTTGVESEDVIINCDSMINNDVEDHESSAYKSVDEALSPMREQTQQQSQAEYNEDVTAQYQLYQQDHRNLDKNKEKDDIRIEEYFLEGDNVVNDENNNVIFPLQGMEASWSMQDALAYCLHDKEGFVVNEFDDLKPSALDIGREKLGLKYCNDEQQIFEHSDETISKDNKAIVQEETASCISKDEKPTLREDFVTI